MSEHRPNDNKTTLILHVNSRRKRYHKALNEFIENKDTRVVGMYKMCSFISFLSVASVQCRQLSIDRRARATMRVANRAFLPFDQFRAFYAVSRAVSSAQAGL